MALLQDTWTKGVLLHIPIGLTSDSNCMTGHPYKKYRQSPRELVCRLWLI